jgi:hypothetical protein
MSQYVRSKSGEFAQQQTKLIVEFIDGVRPRGFGGYDRVHATVKRFIRHSRDNQTGEERNQKLPHPSMTTPDISPKD